MKENMRPRPTISCRSGESSQKTERFLLQISHDLDNEPSLVRTDAYLERPHGLYKPVVVKDMLNGFLSSL